MSIKLGHRKSGGNYRQPGTTGSDDYFPTPPPVTRTLLDFLDHELNEPLHQRTCLEPAAGGGHMLDVLAERFASVEGRDLYDPEHRGWGGHDYLDGGLLHGQPAAQHHWAITNPPFKHAASFAKRMIIDSTTGSAILARLNWLEGINRHQQLFARTPPQHVIVFTRRASFKHGRLNINQSGLIAFAWFVWHHPHHHQRPTLHWRDWRNHQHHTPSSSSVQ